jgi:hypothetical protein
MATNQDVRVCIEGNYADAARMSHCRRVRPRCSGRPIAHITPGIPKMTNKAATQGGLIVQADYETTALQWCVRTTQPLTSRLAAYLRSGFGISIALPSLA